MFPNPKASLRGESSEFFQVPELIFRVEGGRGERPRNFYKSQRLYGGGEISEFL